MKTNKKRQIEKERKTEEMILIFLVLSAGLLVVSYISMFVSGGVSSGGNSTVLTTLTVGNTYPEVLNVSINGGSGSITLNANTTKIVYCEALIRDYNNETNFNTVWAEFFNSSGGVGLGDSADNNDHYYNYSCNYTTNTGDAFGYADDEYVALANCTFSVLYYANPTNWNCTVFVNDSENWNATNSDNASINELIALEVPDTINYGTVNATEVSSEIAANVSNAGNVWINLSLSGYAWYIGDGNAMNCTAGNVGNISIEHEKYNITASNTGSKTLDQANAVYKNLSSSVVVNQLDLNQRQNDTDNLAINASYWRIYVPTGVAGTCRGNIVFGATQGAAT